MVSPTFDAFDIFTPFNPRCLRVMKSFYFLKFGSHEEHVEARGYQHTATMCDMGRLKCKTCFEATLLLACQRNLFPPLAEELTITRCRLFKVERNALIPSLIPPERSGLLR
ncbi:hypothetical protein GOODEAATRI_033392 [Goodea atripinnis]|uniref:Uncharacterized protein n=1 Tax=Goodea atripinnis TaxID=208336 RepID=A0ABV0MMR7_9TELE